MENSIKSIVIIGKRWFDRVNGNTYFSAIGLVDGEEKARIDFSYGYGDQYQYGIFRELGNNGILTGVEHYKNRSMDSFWQYCDRNGIKHYCSVSDVSRKKDL